MAISTTTTLTELLDQAIAEAMLTLQEQEVMRPLVENRSLVGFPGLQMAFPIYDPATAGDATEDTDYTTTNTVQTTEVVITCSEVVAAAQLTDLALMSTPQNLGTDVGRILGSAIAKKVDEDLVAYFTGFSQTVAGAGVALTADHLWEARRYLEAAIAAKPYNLVLHPKQVWGPKGLTNLFTNVFEGSVPGSVSEDFARNGFSGMVQGFNVYADSNINDDVAAGGDAAGGAFSREAIVYVLKRDLEVEVERDASLRAQEMVATLVKGDGEKRDNHGVYVLSDVS